MKKLILSFFSLSLIGAASAQITITEGSGSTDVSGTVVTVTLSANNDNFAEFGLTNSSSGDIFMFVKRLMIDPAPSTWQNWVCLGLDGGSATCYSAQTANPWTTPDPAGHTDNNGDITIGVHPGETAYMSTHVNPYDNMTGSQLIRYYVQDDHGAVLDSVDVNYVTVLGIKENKSTDVSVSAFPNPASNFLTLNAVNVNSNAAVRMSDVLGKVVFEGTIADTKKIDVSEMKNGVYLISIAEEGKAVLTKRIVVKH